MTKGKQAVEDHYTRSGLGETILEALQRAGKDPNNLTLEDLAPVDHMHIRGREATIELARLASIDRDAHVLDVGCGIGGPARHLAAEFGCRVTGLDLTEEYIRVATMLAERTGLSDRVDFRHGDAIDMPFGDASFDVVWTQHTSMNIADKAGLYSEMRRVLKLGGRLAVYDVVAGAGGEIHFPVPWARDPSVSFLISADGRRELLEKTGFRVLTWRDATRPALDWFRRMTSKAQAGGPPPLGRHLLIGPDYWVMAQNQVRNLEENRVALVQAVLDRVR
ncbi:MAG: class I SAM-dependent methyltransferase [Nitrospinota bacterium]